MSRQYQYDKCGNTGFVSTFKINVNYINSEYLRDN